MGFPVTRRLLSLFKQHKPRKEDRVPRKLPVKVYGDKVEGVTRDLSPSGVYFEAESHFQVGSMIKIMIDFDTPQRMRLECEGTVVRVENQGSRTGVAVKVNPLHSTLTRFPETQLSHDFHTLESREHLPNLKERPSAAIIRCANPRSPRFGQAVWKCEFKSLPECDFAARDFDKEFGCKFALLKAPALAPPAGNA